MKDILDYNLKDHNTFGIDAKCRRYVEFSNAEELKALLPSVCQSSSPYIIIGGGSNLLLTRDYDGTVMRSAIKGIEAIDEGSVVTVGVGSGVEWDEFVVFCLEQGWYGAENLSGIPGDVGASAVQNIGAYGVEVKDIIVKVEAVDVATGETRWIYNEDCEYGYRQSRFKKDWKNQFIITRVVYRLSKKFTSRIDYGNIRQRLVDDGVIDNVTAGDVRRAVIAIRNEKLPDPRVEGNAGSFFMNPIVERAKYDELAALYPDMPHYPTADGKEKIPAGWMIEQCGWKGKTLGRAGVHSKQALVLVNKGGATGEEIVALCNAVRKDVFDKFAIEINPEVNII